MLWSATVTRKRRRLTAAGAFLVATVAGTGTSIYLIAPP
jgi:hypothetical protein